MWYYESFVDPRKEVHTISMNYSAQLQMLLFQPLKFYLTPLGFNWTICLFYFTYLFFLLIFAYQRFDIRTSNKTNLEIWMNIILWLSNIGFIAYEIFEFFDDMRGYFSLKGLDNAIDISISILWIIIALLKYIIISSGTISNECDSNCNMLVNNYLLIFGIQIVLIAMRCTMLLQISPMIGVILRIVQLMSVSFVKFGIISIMLLLSFTFGLYQLIGNASDDISLWWTFTYVFQLYTGANGMEDTGGYYQQIFSVVLIIVGMLILMNLLIALMTTEYENVQEDAQKEVSYMSAQITFDLSNRNRMIPPPLNIIVIAVGVFVHVINLPLALLLPAFNLYSYVDYHIYQRMESFYIGCNSRKRKKYQIEEKAESETNQIFNKRWNTFVILSGFAWIVKNVPLPKFLKCCSKCRNMDMNMDSMTAECYSELEGDGRKKSDNIYSVYHKNCYCNLKLNSGSSSTTTVRGISMKEYIEILESEHQTKIDVMDKILLKHLTVDTLFCDRCFKPFLESSVDDVMVNPMSVLLDILSSVMFLCSAWIPLIFIFGMLALFESVKSCWETKKDDDANYAEFDREYFPHALLH